MVSLGKVREGRREGGKFALGARGWIKCKVCRVGINEALTERMKRRLVKPAGGKSLDRGVMGS